MINTPIYNKWIVTVADAAELDCHCRHRLTSISVQLYKTRDWSGYNTVFLSLFVDSILQTLQSGIKLRGSDSEDMHSYRGE